MLVLARKVSEVIEIGTGDKTIKIMVVAIMGETVRIGIEAPKDVPVHRAEVAEAIRREQGK